MTNEEKKEALCRYMKIKRQIERYNLEIQEIRSAKMYPGMNAGDGMPHAQFNNKDLSDYIVQLDRLYTKIIKLCRDRARILVKITDAIDKLPDENQKDIIYLRYIQDMKWEEICTYIGYSWKQTHRIHSNALKNIQI